MCSMDGASKSKQVKQNGQNGQDECPKCHNDNIRTHIPNMFANFLTTLENRGLGDYIDQCSRSSNGFYDMSKNTTNHGYISSRDAIITHLTANGRRCPSTYESIFKLDFNTLYLIENLVHKVQNEHIIQFMDDMITAGYPICTIRSFLIRAFSINFDKRKPRYLDSVVPTKCHLKNVITPQYGQLLDLVNMFYHDQFDIVEDSELMYEVVNYYFMRALESAGMAIYDYNPDIMRYLMNFTPFDVAMNTYYLDYLGLPVAQSLVEDGGFVNTLGNTIKKSFDLPNQMHSAAQNVARAANSAMICGDRISEMSDILKTFIDAFMSRANDFRDKIESSTVITLVEVFIDFISDLHDLKSVPVGRWITYVSRILRCFIPNCISLAIEFVNTYIVGVFTAVVQGSSDLLITLVTALTGVIAIGSVPTLKQNNQMVEYMKAINISVPFSKNIVAMMQNIIKMLPECIKGWFSQFVPEHFFYLKLINEYQEVLNSIDDFLNMEVDTIYFSSELQKAIAKTYVASHSLVKDMAPFISDTSGQFSLLREQLRKFDKLYDSVTALQRCGITRACPFSLTIYGSSQIGKSTLSAAVAKYMFPTFLPDKVRYVVPADPDEFWNGYSALHPVTCEDDADQDAEYKAALRFFSIITNAPYQPPMASLDDVSVGKKGTPYHSKMHIRCTNIAWPNPTTKVLSREAYWKRRHMLVEARVKAEYKMGNKVMYDPLFRHLEFFELDPIVENSNATPIGDVMDFFDLLRSRYDRHMENEDRILAVMNATGTEFVKDLEEAFSRNFFTDAVAQGKLTDLLNQSTTMVTNRMQSTYNTIKQYLDEHPNISRICKVIGTVTAISSIAASVLAIYSSLFMNLYKDSHDNRSGKPRDPDDETQFYYRNVNGEWVVSDLSKCKRMVMGEWDDAECEAMPSGDMRTAKYRKFAKKTAHAEGTSDASAESLTRDVIRGRQAFLKIYDDDNKKTNSMCGLFIGGRYLLAPYHLFVNSEGKIYKEHSRFTITTDCVVFEEMFVPEKLVRLKTNSGQDKDVAIYECSKRVKLYKDIRHHFISESDLANLSAWNESTLNKYRDGNVERELINCSAIVNKQYQMWNSEQCLNLYKGFQYDAVTVSGDCGSVLVLYNTRIRGKILGIHVAGERAKHHGYSEMITCDMLKDFNPLIVPAPLPLLTEDEPAIAMVEGNYTYYGTLPREMSLFPVSKTEIKPSLIHGKINAPVTKPADLNKRNFGEAISKYFEPPLPINPKVIPILVQDQVDIFKQLPRFTLGGVVSEDIAINGDASKPYCDGMNMHTSPGLPYKLSNPGKGKLKYFGIDDNNRYYVTDPQLRARIDHRIEMAKQGKMVDSTWVDIPKDERRKVGKKTRMIVIPPMDYTIVFRQYFMDFITNFYNNHLNFYSAVGMNPYSYDWTALIDKLKGMSNNGGAGDWKQFDGKLFAEIADACLQAINRYYAEIVKEANHDVNKLVRSVLFEELIHTRTQCCNVLYCTHCGNPSGCPFTTILNTMSDDMYFKTAWMMLAPDHLKSLKHYHENVTIFLYGDDNIKSISGAVASWFNEKTIQEYFTIHGLTYTNAKKSSEMEPVEPIETLSFLKNSIRREGLIYHATMEEDTLNEMVNWIRESDDDYAATVTNCNMALMMWYHYGRERFEEERDKILAALAIPSVQRGNLAHLYSFSYLDECFKDERFPDMPVTAVAQGGEGEGAHEQTAGESNEQNIKEETTISDAITFIEQKPSVVINKDVIMDNESYLTHGDWNLHRMLARPQRMGTYSFSTTQTVGLVLKRYSLPAIFQSLSKNVSNILSSYTYIRYRPVFRIQLNGNKFTAGRLLAMIEPYTPSGDIITFPENIRGATALEHAFLDASSNDVVTITAPWLCPFEYINYAMFTDTTANRYRHTAASTFYTTVGTHKFQLVVFNQLSVGTGAPTSINATIWMHLEDVQLGIPVVSAATTQGGTHSYVTNNMQGWSKVANATLPNNVKGDDFDLKADLKLSTMDKPNDTMTPIYTVRRAMGYFAHATNIEVLDRLALHPGGTSTSTFADFGTDYDEMSLEYLCSKYTFYYRTSIGTTQTTGSVLTFCPITPYILPKVDRAGPSIAPRQPVSTWCPAGSQLTLPLVSYVSMPFNFWTGAMKFRFDFITNAFVTAKVACTIIYGSACPDTITAGIEPTSGLSYVFEVNADNKTFEVEVPYVADTPWKHVMNGQFVQDAVTNASVHTVYDDLTSYRTCTGQIALYVINPLSVPSGLPTTYDINVFVAGGKDFQLNFLSRANTGFYPVSQGNIDPNPGTDISYLGNTRYRDNSTMSERYVSVKDILKRYAHVFTESYKIGGVGTEIATIHSATYTIPIARLIMPFWSSVGASLNYASNIHNWYLALYRLWRGSMRVKVLFNLFSEDSANKVEQSAISVDFIPSWTYLGNEGALRELGLGTNDESAGANTQFGGNSTLTNTTHHGPRDISDSNSAFHEIEIPFVYWNRVAPVPNPSNTGVAGATALDWSINTPRSNTYIANANDFGAIMINFPRAPESYYITARFFLAFGDDFRAGGQMPTPMISYGTCYAGTTTPTPTTAMYSINPDLYN